jgi:hypothetical protein
MVWIREESGSGGGRTKEAKERWKKGGRVIS